MAPSGDAYNVDWVFSNTSDVHVATNRDWFTSFTPFETTFGHIYNDAQFKAAGVGTVELKLKLYNTKRSGQKNSRIITLYNVLYVPEYISNVFGLSGGSNPEVNFSISPNGAVLTDQNGARAGLMDKTISLHLRLHGQPSGISSLDPNKAYLINARWPATERARWESFKAGQKIESVVAANEDGPYTTEEKAWLKKHYRGEFNFLRCFGLSIYKEDDRAEGRGIARALMEEGSDGTEAQKQNSNLKEEHDENDDEHGIEGSSEDDEDDEDNFLQELEDDPMSHLADYNFSGAELKWIQKHYRYSSNFMLSYGLKPYDQGDCDEAKAIIKAMMEDN